MKKVILLHGKDSKPNARWYPYIKSECEKIGLRCQTPDLGQQSVPILSDWLEIISNQLPDGETVLVGHSRGGMAILRWMEKPNRPVGRVILVAANSAKIVDQARGDFYSGPYDFKQIKQNSTDFVILHSRDDQWVPYQAAIENRDGLDAKMISFEHKNHFGKQPDGSEMTVFPELLQEILR